MTTKMPIVDTNLSDILPEQAKVTKTKSLHVQLLGKHIDLKKVSEKLSHHYFCQQYKDALFVDLPRGNAFLFDYGVVVLWSIIEAKRTDLLDQIKPFIVQLIESRVTDLLQYSVQPAQTFSISDDVLVVPNTDVHTLLSCSHALAQSSKLEHFESVAEHSIDEHLKLTDSLASTGKIPLSRKALSMERGKLFKTKADILLHFNLLDTPEYFWHHPEHEMIYSKLSTYLELTPRVHLLSLKLTTIVELLDMLATEQQHKYATALEWIIILLIALDILVYFIGD